VCNAATPFTAKLPTAARLAMRTPQTNLAVAGEEAGEEPHRPRLQGLGQEGVAGVGEGPARDRPGLAPFERVIVDRDPHELGMARGRVGVVELHDDVGKAGQSSLRKRKRRMMSRREEDTRKYRCLSRSSRPASVLSLGYGIYVMFSPRTLASTASA
jgi:hypothetical protein